MSNVVENVVENVKTQQLIDLLVTTYPNFDISHIILVVPDLIKHVESFKSLSGLDKKNIVIDLLKLLVDKTDLPGDDELLDPILKKLIPNLIDTLIKVDNKSIKLKKKQNCLSYLKVLYRKILKSKK